MAFWSKPQIWSNLIFILPVSVAIINGYLLGAILLIATFIVSIIYHSFQEEVDVQWFFLRKNVPTSEFIAGVLDYVCSILLVVLLTTRFFSNGPSNFMTAIFAVLVIIGFIIFLGPNYFSFLNRWTVTRSHSMWHIVSGIIATITLV
ncbi:MAG: hypothetical protein WA051_02120 [Minisyncoccia bacterium]